jgi:hypothetical protein
MYGNHIFEGPDVVGQNTPIVKSIERTEYANVNGA